MSRGPSSRPCRLVPVKSILVHMPFGLAERPALGLSLLKPALESRGTCCDIVYPNLAFAVLLGLDGYRRIANELPEHTLAGEWVFSEALFGPGAAPLAEYGPLVLSRWNQRVELLDLLDRARSLAGPFVEEFVASVSWCDYGLVGFASTCHQNVAALAVARQVKALHPAAAIVFGGPNWDGAMGIAQLEQFAFVDFACLGEADLSLPMLAERLAAPKETTDPLPGVARRVGDAVVVDAGGGGPQDLDALPLPDYGDYFAALDNEGLTDAVAPTFSVETSRGCWWVRSGPCTFCGQNRTSSSYRTKSVGRAVSELVATADLTRDGVVELADNVVARQFLSEALPVLAHTSAAGRLFYEARPTVTKDDVAHMAASGSCVQFGIESLSDHVLALMKKGTRALENIRLLKWCREFGVQPVWNLLYGVPGETADDFEATLRILPALRFLEPPRNCGPIGLDRFSTYFEEAERYGLSEVRPIPSYARVYPLPARVLERLAYSFDFERSESRVMAAYRFRIRREVERWRREQDLGEPRWVSTDRGAAVVRDTRPGATARTRALDPLERLIVQESDDICTRDHLRALARARVGAGPTTLDERLRRLADERLLVSAGGRYLSLVLPAGGGATAWSADEAAAMEVLAPSRAKSP